MIPQAFIYEWSQKVPWQSMDQVEQDLLICRVLIEIYSDNWLSENLAFRGGTALHKLYFLPQNRYSEDIDLVQIKNGPFGPIADRLRERLSFLGDPIRKQKANNFTLFYRFDSEFPPSIDLKLKIETNTREHFSILGLRKFPFELNTSWFKGECELTTYFLEELLATKLRALYQRRKGRDLFDLYTAIIKTPHLDIPTILSCFEQYLEKPISKSTLIKNLENKMIDEDFLGDTKAIITPDLKYDPILAFELVKDTLLDKL